MKNTTIAIIGTGAVGSTTAFALILKKLPVSILLIDPDEKRCAGEALDLQDADPSIAVNKASLKQAGSADIIIITAGAKQKPEQKKPELFETNKEIIKKIIEGMQPINKKALIMVVSNPLDALALYAQKISGLPTNQVFGSGTHLDTHRLHAYVAQQFQVPESTIHAYVLGEHGDTQFVAWSDAKINGKSIATFKGASASELQQIEEKTMRKPYDIIATKGATFFGIASCVADICNIIIEDKKEIVPLSCYLNEFGIYMSMPVVLARNGIERVVPVALDEQEKQKLIKSVNALRLLQ